MMDNQQEKEAKLKDKTLKCVDCGNEFTWSSGEQLFFISKGLATPKRCLKCRTFRKLTIARDKGVRHD